MTSEQLTKPFKAVPFRPFTLHTANGESHRVPEPNFMMDAPGTPICGVTDVNGVGSIIDLLLVTRISFDPVADAGTGPSSDRRGRRT